MVRSSKPAKASAAATLGEGKKASNSKVRKRDEDRPTMVQMVREAILQKTDRKGSSLQYIKKYMTETWGVELVHYNKKMKDYLRGLLESGELVQMSGNGIQGRFKFPSESQKAAMAAKKAEKPSVADVKGAVKRKGTKAASVSPTKKAKVESPVKRPAPKKRTTPVKKKVPAKKPQVKKMAKSAAKVDKTDAVDVPEEEKEDAEEGGATEPSSPVKEADNAGEEPTSAGEFSEETNTEASEKSEDMAESSEKSESPLKQTQSPKKTKGRPKKKTAVKA